MVTRLRDRRDAGERLAVELERRLGRGGRPPLVLGLPRGGVPVAAVVAERLGAELDVFIVRKLGVPGHEELAMGAIASGGVRVLNPEVVDLLRIPPEAIERVAADELEELQRRDRLYRGGQPAPALTGRTVVLVDDGLATGATMRAAVEAVRSRRPERLVVAVPVGAAATVDALAARVDEVVCLMTPEPFRAVGLWYERFEQTTDEEVRQALREQERRGAERSGGGSGGWTSA